jgi:hypothetical protein
MSHIGNVDADLDATIIQALEVNGIVELLAAIGIDSEGLLVTEVTPVSQCGFTVVSDRPILEPNVLDNSIGELVWAKVVIAKKSIGLDFRIAHLTQLLDEGAERMERSDRPPFDASDEDAVRIILVFLYEIARSLFGGDSDEGNALISGLEPNNLRLILLTFRLAARILPSGLSLSFLLLLGCLTART